MARVGVLFVHGMGNQSPGYARPLQQRVETLLGSSAGEVAFESAHYRDPLEAAQARLWDLWKPHTGGADDPDLAFLRYGLVVSGFGDVLAYVQHYRRPIHLKICGALQQLGARVQAGAPLCIVAHSLGSVIVDDYIRRHQAGRPLADDAFSRTKTLRQLYTLGSPLPLFRLTSALPPVDVPTWVNFYSRADVFGMPLKVLGEAYANVVEDVRSSNRGLIDGHLGYWKNNGVARRIADGLGELLA